MAGVKFVSTSAVTFRSTQQHRPLVCYWSTVQNVCTTWVLLVHTLVGLTLDNQRGFIIRKSRLIWYQSKNVSSGTVQTSDQMKSCTINYLRVSPSLFFCISQHILLFIYAVVWGTASLSQLWYTMCVCVCVCNKVFMFSMCVCVWERTSVLGWWSHRSSIRYMCELDSGWQWCCCLSEFITLGQWNGVYFMFSCVCVCPSYGWVTCQKNIKCVPRSEGGLLKSPAVVYDRPF